MLLSSVAAVAVITVASADPNTAMLLGLVARAQIDMQNGDIAAARARLTPAAKVGIAPALRLLGQTYDPRWLYMHNVIGPVPDPELAVKFYMAAKAMGDQEAGEILEALNQVKNLE